jgi:hypothetical protein
MATTTIWPRRGFRLPHFELAPLEFSVEKLADEILLTDKVAGDSDRVVHLVHPRPTPGELDTRIQQHLGRKRPGDDAAEELRTALAELRLSLG